MPARQEWLSYRKVAINDWKRLNRESALRLWDLMDNLARDTNAEIFRNFEFGTAWLESARRREMQGSLRTVMAQFADNYKTYISADMRAAAGIAVNAKTAELAYYANTLTKAGVYGPAGELQALAMAMHSHVPTASLEAIANRVSKSGLKLSDDIWMLTQSGLRQIEDITTAAALEGKSATWLARAVEQNLRPDKMGPGWTSRGKPPKYPLSGELRGYVGMKGRPYTYYSAMSLARTELRLTSFDATIRGQMAMGAYLEPRGLNFLVGVKWNLAAEHPETDICDEIAAGSSQGLPEGVYLPGEVPDSHPLCLCFLTDEMIPPQEYRDMADAYLQKEGMPTAMEALQQADTGRLAAMETEKRLGTSSAKAVAEKGGNRLGAMLADQSPAEETLSAWRGDYLAGETKRLKEITTAIGRQREGLSTAVGIDERLIMQNKIAEFRRERWDIIGKASDRLHTSAIPETAKQVAWEQGLAAEERGALEKYMSYAYNSPMPRTIQRIDAELPVGAFSVDDRLVADGIRAAIRTAPKEQATIYRGLGINSLDDISVGSRFEFEQFTSWSRDRSIATGYSVANAGEKQIQIVLQAKADIVDIARFGHRVQKEVLLDRGTAFRVVSITRDRRYGDVYHVVLGRP